MSNALANVDLLKDARDGGGLGGGASQEQIDAINDAIDLKFDKAGGTVSGPVTLSDAVTFASTATGQLPTLAAQFATKGYVDGVASGQASNTTVRAATTANITIATALNNGDTLDGVTLATNDLVLVKDQTDPAQNGIYVVGASPARDAAFDSFGEHFRSLISVTSGTTNANTIWLCMAAQTGTLDTTAIPFVIFASGAVQVTGNQTIGGTKTFSISPVVPTPSTGDNSTKAATTAFVQTTVAPMMRWVTGVPTGGADGDKAIRDDGLFTGHIWRRTSGSWARVNKDQTWEQIMALDAASCTGLTVHCTTALSGALVIDQDFYCNGTVWKPVGGRGYFGNSVASSSHTGSTSESAALKTIVVPGGMVLARSRVGIYISAQHTGTAGSKTTRIRNGSTSGTLMMSQGGSATGARLMCGFDVPASGTTHTLIAAGDNDDGFVANSTVVTTTIDWSSNVTFVVTSLLGNAGDSSQITRVEFEWFTLP